jgi:hypothetical protein
MRKTLLIIRIRGFFINIGDFGFHNVGFYVGANQGAPETTHMDRKDIFDNG